MNFNAAVSIESSIIQLTAMGVYPKSALLNISMITCSLVGIFPWEFMFENNKMLKKIYRAISNIILTYFIIFILTQFTQLYFLINGPTIRTDELSQNVSLSIYYIITLIRQLIIKNRAGFLKLIEYIIEVENTKSVIEDEETQKIEDKEVKKCQKIGKFYIAHTALLTIVYCYLPLIMNDEVTESGNDTKPIKHFPLSSWFPFDEQNYYKIAYMYQLISALVGVSYATYTDIFMCNLIIFPTGQLKKLQHFFRNFEKYKLKVKEMNGILDDDKAGQITCVNLIATHRKLIAYIDYFNETMGSSMVFDFIQSSVQIASIVTQTVSTDEFKSVLVTVFGLSAALLFVSRMVIRLFLYYYFANEIIISSQQIGSAIWESNWYEQSPRTKFLLRMVMIRCRKPLSFNIGPFSVMSVDSAISILKAAYSYITLTIR